MSNPLLAARSLFKSHGATRALRGASVDLRAGEILAVTGASGSGKSTLLHCLAGIVRPDEGTVDYGGERLDRFPERRLSELRRTDFGVVFQFGQLIPELTALDNVALPLLLAGTSRTAAQERAGEWLERFGVRGQAALRPGEMSGGQAQRVSLARALVTGPKVVFADEPTGALDSLAGEQVMTALIHTARESGTAVLLITHDAQVAAYADREVSLRDGVVVGSEGHAEIRSEAHAEIQPGVGSEAHPGADPDAHSAGRSTAGPASRSTAGPASRSTAGSKPGAKPTSKPGSGPTSKPGTSTEVSP